MTYFVLINNEQVGPLSKETIAEYIREGKINGDTLVWYESIPSWAELHSTELAPELHAVQTANAQTVVPPPSTSSAAVQPTAVFPGPGVTVPENRKWWGFSGSIGRMDYFVNSLLCFGGMLVFVGVIYFAVSYSGLGLQTFSDRHPASAGFNWRVWAGVFGLGMGCIGMLLMAVAGLGNLHRRLTDIRGKSSGTWPITGVTYVLSIIPYVQMIVSLIVLFMPGQLSKKSA